MLFQSHPDIVHAVEQPLPSWFINVVIDDETGKVQVPTTTIVDETTYEIHTTIDPVTGKIDIDR